MFPIIPRAPMVAALVLAGACTQDASIPPVASFLAEAPENAPPGTCWEVIVDPAVIETVTDQSVVQPPQVASDGSVLSPAIYRTRTRQVILRDREETWFETVCAQTMTPDFITTLQRALAARAYYRGPIHGQMDDLTKAALRRYQSEKGLDSAVLSIASAQWMGLVPTVEIEG
ncbi:MAG: peptidoglycan-binding domain-containing protein [Pseudomonadota bacterium]